MRVLDADEATFQQLVQQDARLTQDAFNELFNELDRIGKPFGRTRNALKMKMV